MFDHLTMKSVAPHDDEERTDNKNVQIFIIPALFKRGDADGENFDEFSTIELSVVLWEEFKTAKPQTQEPMPPRKPLVPPKQTSAKPDKSDVTMANS